MNSTANLTTDSSFDLPGLETNGSTNIINTIDTNKEIDIKFKDLPFLKKLVYIKNILTVEPLLCLYILPTIIGTIAVQNLQLQMACRTNLHLNDTICSDLLNSGHELDVQIVLTEMIPWKTGLATTIPAILVLFYGSYSDRHKKRKPFLIMPLFGEILSTIFLLLCAINISNWPAEVAGISETLFSSLSGSLTLMLTTVYSYIADITTEETRTGRIGLVHIIASASAPIGLSLSGILFETIGYYGIFAIYFIFYIIAFCYGIFYLKEPKLGDNNLPKKCICIDIYDPRHIIHTIITIFKKRRGTERLRIILLMITFIVILGPSTGEAVLNYLYTRTKFQWTGIEYSAFATYDIIIHLIGTTLAIIIFTQWLKLDDLILAIIACSCKVAASFVYAFGSSTVFYLAPVVSFFSGAGAIAMRSIATKLVGEDELGKMQSIFAICEAITPLIYTSLYSQVYAATINTVPGAFYLMGAGLISPAIIIFVVMYILKIREANMKNENKTEPDNIIMTETENSKKNDKTEPDRIIISERL